MPSAQYYGLQSTVCPSIYTVLCARAVLYGHGLESTIATVSTSTTKYYVASTQPIGMRMQTLTSKLGPVKLPAADLGPDHGHSFP